MTTTGLLSIYSVLIVLASIAGGLIPLAMRLTHRRLELASSFVAGVMLGIGLLHMLPHAWLVMVDASSTSGGGLEVTHEVAHDLIGSILLWVIIGFLVMFLVERFFCFHHHDEPGDGSQPSKHRHSLTWGGAALGLSLHSLLEGVALASSIAVGLEHEEGSLFAGLGVFLVIILHKPFDSLTLGTLLASNGRSVKMRHVVNAAFSLLVPIGAGVFFLGFTGAQEQPYVLAAALAFSAGMFLCIAMSDLLPELQFHQHDRIKLSGALILGLAVAWMISQLEQGMHSAG